MLTARPLTLEDAGALYRLYALTPRYFEIISSPPPLESDIRLELETALADPRRRVEFLVPEGAPAAEPIGYLDLKLDYPGPGDATINLLMIAGPHQSQGYGIIAVRRLEERLRFPRTRRLLASVYGHNPGAVRFWERLGYRHAIDARPVVQWYAKEFAAPSPVEAGPAALGQPG